METHIAYGSQKNVHDRSPYVSTTRSYYIAKNKYGKVGRVAKIVLNLGPAPYFETCQISFANTKAGVRARNFSQSDQEVLIMGPIPAAAIISYD